MPTHLSLISTPQDGEIATIGRQIDQVWGVGGRSDLERVLCDLLSEPAPHDRTLDLIGHSTSDHSLLRLGYWVIDGQRHTVTAFFRELADHDVFSRLRIRALRLLGCETAVTIEGRATLVTLSEILGIPVLGTREMLSSAHYDADGFSSSSEHVLVGARDAGAVPAIGEPCRRTFDIDAMSAAPLQKREWPSLIATTETARAILRLIRRSDGAYMPGLDPIPELELCLPSTTRPSWYTTIQIVLGESFVRVYADAAAAGVVFPVSDPEALRALLKSLPRL